MASRLSLAALVLGFASSVSAVDRIPVPAGDRVIPDGFTPAEEISQPVRFMRGDVDGSGELGMSDALQILSSLFLDMRQLDCEKAADTDDNGQIGIGDAVRVLSFLFLGNVEIPAPFEECGEDTTADGLTCEKAGACAAEVRSSAFQMTRVQGGYLVDLPAAMARAIPEGAEVRVELEFERASSRSLTGLATRVSGGTLLLDTNQRLAAAVQGGFSVKLAINSALLLPARRLDFACGARTCGCVGDADCNDLFDTDLCGSEALCLSDGMGGLLCICIRK